MNKIVFIILLFTCVISKAEDDIELKIEWVENVAKNAVLEVCGTAISKSAKWPLIVSIEHGDSKFSTVTSKEGRYCQLIGRQTFNGEVNVTAMSFDGQSIKVISLKPSNQ